ncbi:MAG: beta-ketoacyl synthase N-terminal-like domain-containing protein [Bacteroides sp.]|nr:beta-ketoacyl synthase N-terminal-like domain-containing protein [Bacteroides sp.]
MSNIVYITGAGIISAIGNNQAEVKQALLDEKSGIGPMRFLRSEHHELPCGEVKLSNDQLRARLNIPSRQVCNRTALLGIEAIRQALEQSGAATDKAYLISGTTVGGMDNTEQHFLDMLERDEYLDLLSSHDSGSTTGLMANYFGIQPQRSITISTACSSSANALIVGTNLIKAGKADVVIAGGSEALSLFHLNGFNTLMILDTQRCRPFDDTRSGLNLGEGAAFVVLESARSVAQRDCTPLAILAGYGNKCDAFHQTASSENGEGAYLAMKEALEMAQLRPQDIGYVNAHGTGTPNNDASESVAIQRIFAPTLPCVSSTKSFTGHTTSASGGIETVISLLALLDGFVPANLGWKYQMPSGITPVKTMQKAALQHVMCNSFGFGGNDSSLILSSIDTTPRQKSAAADTETTTESRMPTTICLSTVRHTPDAPMDNLKEFMSPMESRRLCRLLKATLMTALTALREAGIETPDAIIVGTSYGMLENSEKFLLQMCREGEHGLSPTLFMQSTHNTIAGLLAIRTHCKGYNITYTELGEQRVLDLCLQDAKMLMAQGKIKNALIGYHNEVTPALHDMLLRLKGEDQPVGVTSVSMVIQKQE